jgi:hypothetical protein
MCPNQPDINRGSPAWHCCSVALRVREAQRARMGQAWPGPFRRPPSYPAADYGQLIQLEDETQDGHVSSSVNWEWHGNSRGI